VLGATSWEFDCSPITQLVVKIWKEYCAWFCQAVCSNLFLLLPSCIVNLSSKSASQGEGYCIIVRDQYLSWVSTAALNCFLPQKSVSGMTRGRSRKKRHSSNKSTDEMIIPKLTRWRDCYSSSMTHKPQKRKTRRFYRNASKQHSPKRTRNRERLFLCSRSSQSKCPSSRYKSSFVHHLLHCQPTT
jgi:hypothetical protein